MEPREVSEQEGSALWRFPELGLELEIPLTVLTPVLAAAKEGFNRFPRGGLEVGGVLFGRREGKRIRVLASRPISCRHLLGPSFTLSPEEHEELARLLVESRRDTELAGLLPVGWYHSHTRSGLLFTDADAHLHNRHFSQSWQFGLLLRPQAGRPTEIGLFLRGKDGELSLRPVLVTREDALPVAGAPPEPSGAAIEPGETPRERRQAAPKRGRPLGSLSHRIAIAVALLVVGAGAAGLIKVFWPGASGARRHLGLSGAPAEAGLARPFQLELEAEDGQLLVRWNPASLAGVAPEEAWLLVRDGEDRKQIALTAAAFEQGSISLERRSEKVTVTLVSTTGGGKELEETACLIGSPALRATPQLPSRTSALREEKGRLKAALREQSAQIDALAERRAALERMLTARAPAVEPPPAPKPQPEPGRRSPDAPAPPVLLEQRPAALAPSGIAPSPAAAAATPPIPVQKPEAAPRAGRLIWTGALGPGRVLTISGRQASLGTFTGQLPGVPVRVWVLPAELASAGLIVYSSDPQHAGAGHEEPPGPRNAWTRTVYRYAPERAATLQVVEAPGAANGWLSIAIRANAPVAAIVIDWESLR